MIHFALVGCGSMANWHAERLKAIPDVKVVALVDTVAEHTRQFREKYFPDAAEYASMEILLGVPPKKLDAVMLVTPHTLHYPQAKAALLKGWHVLIEKPMVTNSEHAYDLWKTVKKTGKQLAITTQSPYSAEFGYLAQERDAGRLGKFQLITGWMSQGWLKATANTWRQKPELSGGGQMYDSGAHVLNAIMWLLNDPVVEVACFYDKCGSPVDINGVAIAKFQNGCLASICIGGNCPVWGTEIILQTDTTRVITDQYGAKLEMWKEGKRVYPHVEQDFASGVAAGSPHLNFVNALLGKEKLRAPVRYGVLLSVLMDAMYQSADTGSVVKVKPVPAKI
jgi:predicted dehydrogenase